MVFGFKKVTCSVATLLLLFVCHSVGYSQQISRTVNYKALFQPFGEGIHKEYPLPAEVEDPDSYFQIQFNFDLTPEDITAEITGTLTFDQENGTLQIRGEDGKLQSEGGISFGGIVKIAFELPPIPAFTTEPILLKVEVPFSISNFLSESYLNTLPIPINALEPWNESASFETFHFNGKPIEVRGGIRDLVRLELTAVDIVGLILTALSQGALPPPVTKLLGIAFEKGVGNAAISYNLGFLSTATLKGKSIIVNGQQITNENQIIEAVGLDLSENSYTVNSSYEEKFTYQLDYVVSGDVWLEFNPLGIPVWSYPKTVIAEFPTPIIPKHEIDLDFTSAQTIFPIVRAETVEPPIAVNTIPTQDLTVPGPSRPVDVAPYFSSQSDLIYEVESNPRGIVTESVSGSQVTIEPLQTGSASVVVTARDSQNPDLSAIQTIPVTVRSNSATIVRPPSDPTFRPPTTTNPIVEGLADGVAVIVRNTGDIGLNIRSAAQVRNQNPDNRIGKVYDGATGTITDGPQSNGIFTWWYIDWDGESIEGWCVEAFGGSQLLFPHPPDLEVRGFNVSDDEVEPGETFTIEATVRNNGPGESAATEIFFYYRKSDENTPRVAGSGKLSVPSLRERRSHEVSLRVEAPMIPGDYEYGAILPSDIPDDYDAKLVDPTGEIRLNNTDHEDVEVTSAPDLIVESISANKSTVDPGEVFRLEATVRNQGIGEPTRNATLRYYRSRDANITTRDTEVGDDTISSSNLDTKPRSESITAPIEPGVYYYGACVDLRFESNTVNNCSSAVAITVRETGPSDLIVSTPTLSANTLPPGQSVTLTTTVQNQGIGPAPTTTLRGYLSSNANISDVDTEVGDIAIGFLAPGATQTVQLRVDAPVMAGTYYYGICVDDVRNESNTVNNCSTGVALTVENLAPVAAGTFPAQTLVVGTASVVGVAPYFSDPNEDTLTYKPSSSSLGIVAVEMSGLSDSHLRMNPLAAGIATVTVEATDPSGLSFSQTFSATVNPPPNRAPVAVGTIPPETLMARGVSRVVDVSGIFHDIDGDTLRYTVRSDNTRVLSTNVSDGRVTLVPLTEGSASVTVTASDGELSASLSIAVSITPYVDVEAWMPDANLRAKVRAALGLQPNDVLTQQMMTELTVLNAASRSAGTGVQDITGLEHATQLTNLDLGRTGVRNLTPLQDLIHLTHLTLWYTNISDLSPIQGLTNLTRLNLHQTTPWSFNPLQGLINLTYLDIGRTQIRDLTLLRGLTALTSLNLSFNNANGFNNPGDLTPLSGLTALTSLNLGYTEIKDITPLKDLTALTYLDLKNNQISDIASVSGLTQLVQLYLEGNQISDVTPLETLTSLQLLRLKYNPIADVAPLRRLKEQNPNVSIDVDISLPNKAPVAVGAISPQTLTVDGGVGTVDIARYFNDPDNTELTYTAVSNNTAVATVSVRGIQVSITPVGVGSAIVTVTASDGELTVTQILSVSVSVAVSAETWMPDANLRTSVRGMLNLAPNDALTHQTMTGLTGLVTSRSQIKDLTGLEHATNLRWLHAEIHQISDITPLAGLTALTELRLKGNQISDITPLAGLTSLTRLNLENNQLNNSGILPLTELTSLTELYLGNNQISDITPLAGLTALTKLGLADNQISDITPLAGLTALVQLWLNRNQISDVSPLETLTSLRALHLEYNPIADVALLRRLKEKNPNLFIDIDIEMEGADLRVESVRVNKTTVSPGETFRLDAVVKNQGEADVSGITLRYYQSTDETISTADAELNTGTLGLVAVDGMRELWAQLTAPDTPGVYYYGICIDAVANESDTANNCSIGISVTVLGADLVINSVRVEKPTASLGEKSRLTAEVKDRGEADLSDATNRSALSTIAPGEQFRLNVGIQNRGKTDSTQTTLRYYLSSGETISPEDMEVHTATLPIIAADAMREPSAQLTAPDTPGVYYYGVCVDAVEGESDTNNNCSTAVAVTVESTDRVDFVVESVRASKTTVKPSENFQVSVVVRNQGEIAATATPIRYYLSTDENISATDTEVHTASLPVIAADATRQQSRQFTAPDTPGTYYYGVCVDAIADESDTTNNCSMAVAVTVGGADLMIDGTPQVSKTTLLPGETFQMDTRVWNAGKVTSPATTLRYYLSTDETISAEDTEVASDRVATLSGKGAHASRRRTELSKTLTAPDTPGTHYYGVCVDLVAGDANVSNNCSEAIAITVEAPPPEPAVSQVSDPVDIQGPDLIISAVRVDASTIKIGGGVRFHITLTNQGTSKAPATIIRYYRSSDATISAEDTELRAVPVGELGSGKSYTTWALLPSAFSVGAYYYGACLDGVASEFDTSNNCSDAIEIIMVLQSDPIDGLESRGRIPTQTLKVEDSPEPLSASRYFAGKVETWETRSSKPAVVTVSMEADSDLLKLAPVSRGHSVVTVTAHHGNTTAQQTFDVYVGIDPTRVLRWGTPVPPQPLAVGGSPLVLDLSGHVTGQVETWRAVSSHPGVVVVSLSGSVVTLTPGSEGNAEVTIHASDGISEVQHTFRVFVGAAGEPDLKWVIPVPPQTLVVGRSPVVLDVSGYVAGEVETWEAVSSNETAVSVSLSGSVVTLMPGSEGSSEVTISARRGDLEVSGTFAVAVGAADGLEWIIPVSPQTLKVGNSPLVLDLSRNVVGEVETWQASSSNEAFVAVSMSGSVVTLTPVRAGSSEVTIRARRGDLEVSGTFTVAVAPDSSPPVSIPDENLRAAVRSALGLEEGDTLTQQKMQGLTRLIAKTFR